MLGFLKKIAKNRKNTTDTALATANTDVAIASTALRYSYPSSVLAHLTVITQQVLYFLQKYPTIEAFYKVFNPQRMVFICQDPQYCILGPSPTLTQMDIMYGPLSFCQVARSINCRYEFELWIKRRCLREPIAVYGCGHFKQIPLAKGWRTDALFLQFQGWLL